MCCEVQRRSGFSCKMCAPLCVWIVVLLMTVAAADEKTTVPCVGDDCNSSTPVTALSRHQLECSATEAKEVGCLHGKCYALDLGGSGNRSLFCECQELFQGVRCEQICAECFIRVMRGKEEDTEEADPVIWVGIGAGFIVVVGVIVVLIVLYRRRRKGLRSHGYGHPGAQRARNSLTTNYDKILQCSPVHTEQEPTSV